MESITHVDIVVISVCVSGFVWGKEVVDGHWL